MDNENKSGVELIENASLFPTESLHAKISGISETEIPNAVLAYDAAQRNFEVITGSLAHSCGEVWAEIEQQVMAPPITDNKVWLGEAITTFPIERQERTLFRDTQEAIARGEFLDVIEREVRTGVRIKEGEQAPLVVQVELPAEPKYVAPQLEANGSSAEEAEQRLLTASVRRNRIKAVGDPTRSLLAIKMPNLRVRFLIAAIATLVMGYFEFSMTYGITGAHLMDDVNFAVTMGIIAVTNALVLLCTERLHHLLTHRSAKKAYAKLDDATRAQLGVQPQPPDGMTYLLGYGGMGFLALCLIGLAVLRYAGIANVSYLKNSEIVIWVLVASVITTAVIELSYSSPMDESFIDEEKKLIAKLDVVTLAAKQQKQLRDARNAQKTAEAEQAYREAMDSYTAALDEAKRPAVDPIEAAKLKYEAAVDKAGEPLDELLTNIKAQMKYRLALFADYHRIYRHVLLDGFANLVTELLDRINDKALRNHYTQDGPAARIMLVARASAPCTLDDPLLDELIQKFEPSVTPVDMLTKIEPIKVGFADDETVKIQKKRQEKAEELAEQARRDRAAEQKAALENLRTTRVFQRVG